MNDKNKLTKKEKINLRILGINKLMNGEINPSLDKYDEFKKLKKFDELEEIGEEYLKELKELDISYFNRVTPYSKEKIYFNPKELETYFYKGNYYFF